MNGTLLSLCLVGAALATANMLMMQRSTCSFGGTEKAAAASTGQPSAKTELISKVKAEPANDQAKPLLPAKDVTGSVKQPTKTDQKQPSQAEAQLREKVAVAGKTKTARGDVDPGPVKQPKKVDQKQPSFAVPGPPRGRFANGPDYYDYDKDCYALLRRARNTGSPYWWSRYDACVGYY
jgi:hypothetical protein